MGETPPTALFQGRGPKTHSVPRAQSAGDTSGSATPKCTARAGAQPTPKHPNKHTVSHLKAHKVATTRAGFAFPSGKTPTRMNMHDRGPRRPSARHDRPATAIWEWDRGADTFICDGHCGIVGRGLPLALWARAGVGSTPSAFYAHFVYDWSTTGLRLVYDWSMTGLRLVYDWSTTDLRLVYDWSTTGLRLVYDWSTPGSSSTKSSIRWVGGAARH